MKENIKIEDLAPIYQEFAEILGVKGARQVYESFRGQQICFAMNFYKREYYVERILSEYDGKNIRALAAKYGYSEKWVREVIKRNK